MAALAQRNLSSASRASSQARIANCQRVVFSSRQLTGRRSLSHIARAEPAGPVNDDTFDELVLKSPVPVLLDFWAPWCGPCRMIAPIIDELAVEYKDKLRCFKLNTDESPQVATEYGIRSIPTVMIFKGGKKMDTIIGAVPKATLVQTVDKYLQ